MKKRTVAIVLIVTAIVIVIAMASHQEGGLIAEWAARIHGR